MHRRRSGPLPGYANCLDAAPGAYDLDEHDIAVPCRRHFGPGERQRLERAVQRCPARALQLEDAATGARLIRVWLRWRD